MGVPYASRIEDHFCGLRGTAHFRFSPEDWNRAIGWEKAGIPLEQALRGLDAAFAAHRGLRKRAEMINGLGWCERFVKAEAKRK